ncbi:MAG: type II secretion system protein [Pirellulaceae bacterium]
MLTQTKTTRRGFTLIELLVTISIIAILASLATWGSMRAYTRAQEFRIEQENSQIALALEAFKTKYGFYPPSGFNYVGATVNDFIPYLNRLSPNHGELADADGMAGGPRRIDIWWNDVGQYLNPETSLAFWLSGIAKNKQYPLTYVDNSGNVQALHGYNYVLDPSLMAAGTNAEREVFFEFNKLFKWRTSNTTGDPGAWLEPIGTIPNPYPSVAVCTQTSGRYEPIVYFSINSLPVPSPNNSGTTLQTATNVPKWDVYLPIGPDPSVTPVPPITVGPYWGFNSATSNNEYYSAGKFQIFSPGIDGFFSATAFTSGNIAGSTTNRFERDNVGNFSEGRLEKLTQ